MKKFSFLLYLIIIIFITNQALLAQDTPPADAPCITITVTENATIQLKFKAPVENTPVWIETAPNTYSYIVANNDWIDFINCTAIGTEIKVHGVISGFNCGGNSTKLVDLSFFGDMSNLTYLRCYGNQLTDVDFSMLTNLVKLICGNNQLINLNVSALTNLTEIYCYNNQFNDLDVSALSNLTYLDCENNELTKLNIANGNNENFICAWNSNNPAVLACGNTNLTCIQVDDGFDAEAAGWDKDPTAVWNDDSSNPCDWLNIEEIALSGIKIYPNPVEDILNIEIQENITDKNIKIYDFRGKILINKNIKEQIMQINLSDFSDGIYYIGIAGKMYKFVKSTNS